MKTNRFSKSLALATPLVGGVIADAEAAGYLKIGDIKGESTIAGFEEYIKIGYFKIEIGREGEGRESEVNFKNPQISFPVEQASPQLMLACATGQILPEATLVLTKNIGGGEEVAYYKVTLTNVLVSSYSTSGSANGETLPTENVTFNYEKIEWTYSKFDQDGKFAGTTTTGRIDKATPKL